MKKIGLLGLVFLIFIGCEDVVDVDLPEVDSRLFIDAFIRIDESDPTTRVRVNAGLTSSFFDDIPPADLQNIIIVNLDQLNGAGIPSFVTLTQTSPGVYEARENTSFFTSGRLLLSISHEDQDYAALTNYVPAVPIEQLSQGDQTLFSGDETEIVISFVDAPDRQDFYLFDLDFDEYLVTEDLFYPGQRFEFSYFYDDGLDAGQELQVSLMGVDIGFYNYMNQLIVQSGGDQGPFQTPTATVRGNIINVTGVDIDTIDFENIDSLEEVEGIDPENVREGFPLGYFAVSQTFSSSIIIE
ncbi:DUF4249 family protein [Ulvibacterium sp.]|uniref:DUF4249 family protein n=1 Tax=Ulvibacterium sp. TaxID=2665914 RepID=UPI003BAB4672